MDGDLNKAMLIGRVTREPTIKQTKSGIPYAVFSLTTHERWFDKTTNGRRERGVSHKVEIFGAQLVGVVEKCVRKGARVYVEGSIEVRRWLGKDGKASENWTCSIVISGWSGRITVLDFADDLARSDPDDFYTEPEPEPDPDPTPLSIARSAAKYGDGTDATPDQNDKIDANLRFLG